MAGWSDEFQCPVCGTTNFIFPVGPKKSPILVIGDEPTDNDLRYARPFMGSDGTVLRQEFIRSGIDTKQFRMTYLWQHQANKKKECLEMCALNTIKEAKDRKLVILITASVVKYFTGQHVDNLMGLMTKSNLFSAPCFCMESLGSVFNKGGVLGETRLAIKKISQYIEREKLL